MKKYILFIVILFSSHTFSQGKNCKKKVIKSNLICIPSLLFRELCRASSPYCSLFYTTQLLGTTTTKRGRQSTAFWILNHNHNNQKKCYDYNKNPGANFDYDKLKWYNHKHIQRTSNDSLASLLAQISPALESINSLKLSKAISLVKERANTIYDLEGLIEYLFIAPSTYNEKSL